MSAPKIINLPPYCRRQGDTKTWINRIEYESQSSNALYTIAQHRERRHWACGCTGYRFRRYCKHLRQLGLAVNEQPMEAQLVFTMPAPAMPPIIQPVTTPRAAVAPVAAPVIVPEATTPKRRTFSLDEDV